MTKKNKNVKATKKQKKADKKKAEGGHAVMYTGYKKPEGPNTNSEVVTTKVKDIQETLKLIEKECKPKTGFTTLENKIQNALASIFGAFRLEERQHLNRIEEISKLKEEVKIGDRAFEGMDYLSKKKRRKIVRWVEKATEKHCRKEEKRQRKMEAMEY